jgi:hypothetical protein
MCWLNSLTENYEEQTRLLQNSSKTKTNTVHSGQLKIRGSTRKREILHIIVMDT